MLFHKLRNIWRDLQAPDHLSPRQSRRHRKAIFRDFCAIWDAQRYQTILRRYLAVVRTPFQAPNANEFAERWVRTAREEYLDYIPLA